MSDEDRDQALSQVNADEGKKWIIKIGQKAADDDATPAGGSDARSASTSGPSEVVTYIRPGDVAVSVDDDFRMSDADRAAANMSRQNNPADDVANVSPEGKGKLSQKEWEEQEDQIIRAERSARHRSEPQTRCSDSRTDPRSIRAAPYQRPQEQRRDQSRVTGGPRIQLSPMPDYHQQAQQQRHWADQERQWVPTGSYSRPHSRRPPQDWRAPRSVSRPAQLQDWNERSGGDIVRRSRDEEQRWQSRPARERTESNTTQRRGAATLAPSVQPTSTRGQRAASQRQRQPSRGLQTHSVGACDAQAAQIQQEMHENLRIEGARRRKRQTGCIAR
jgi:hypothetical protein